MALTNDGSIHHFAAVRLRATGSGNLQLKLLSLSATKEFIANPIALEAATSEEPTKGVNFKYNRAALEFKVTEIDEYFKISKIVLFAKVSATGRPG